MAGSKRIVIILIYFISSIVGIDLFAQTLPSSIPGLQLWVRADSNVLFNGSPATDGSKIDNWGDLSGNSNNAVQSNGADQPVYLVSALNGKPTISFVNNILHFPLTSSAINEYSFSYVVSPVVLPAQTRRPYQTVIASANVPGAKWNMDVGSDGSEGAGWGGTVENPTFGDASFIPTNEYRVITYIKTATGWKIYCNKNFIRSRNDATAPAAGTYDWTIGSNNPGQYMLSGNISEMIIYNQALNDSVRNVVETYLINKYTKKVDLGADIFNSGFCPTTLDVGPVFKNYKWSNGDTTHNTVVSSPGQYWLTVTDSLGIKSSDTIKIFYPVIAAILDNTSLCSGSTLPWNTHLSHSAFTFQWQDNSTDSLFNITLGGQYYITVTDTSGCSKASDTISVTIDNFPVTASLGADTSLCSGNSIYLKNSAAQTTSYTWSDGSANDSLQINTSGQYWVTVSNINSCSKTDTININIAGNAPAALFSSNNTCLGNPIQFTDLSAPPSGDIMTVWNWNFGDNIISALQNPSHTYADTGLYVVKLVATTNAGCSSPYARIIHVFPNPVSSFTSSNLCQDASVQFTGSATTLGYPINQWNWDFNDPSSGLNNNSSLQNPSHVYISNGLYPVRLIITNVNGCADTTINNIIVKPSPVTDFSSSLSCKTDITKYTDLTALPSGTTIQNSYWNFGDLATSTSLNPSHVYAANVPYTVTHVITASNGCKDTALKSITVYPKPYAAFSYGNTCVGSPVNFNDLSVVAGASITGWQWNFGTGSSVIQNPQHTFTTSGNINTQLIVVTNQGCKDTAIQAVTIHPNPVASFTYTPAYGTPPLTAFFNNTSTGASSYSWNFDDGSVLNTLMSPSHVFNDTGFFQISLAAINAFGCTDTITHSINTALKLTDIGISGFTTSFQNNFLTITAQIDNHGTVDVHTMELYAKVNDGPYIKEDWGGSLLKDGTLFYTFNSDIFLTNEAHYVCISALKPNDVNDDRPADNEFCQALTIAGFQIFAPYPNPVESMINLPVFMPVANDLSIDIFNDQGKKVESVYSGSIDEGFHSIQFNTESLNAGLYIFKIMYKNETVIQKFIKNK